MMLVYRQWQEVQLLYEPDLEEQTEDYAQTCWKQGCRKQILTNSCRPRVCVLLSEGGTEDDQYIIQDLCDQDYILNHNKILNPLDHATRAPNQRPNPVFLGTQVYLLIVWYYIEIFCSSMASLQEWMKYAATVTHCLAIWHNYAHCHPRLNIHNNFITRETYNTLVSLATQAETKKN